MLMGECQEESKLQFKLKKSELYQVIVEIQHAGMKQFSIFVYLKMYNLITKFAFEVISYITKPNFLTHINFTEYIRTTTYKNNF